MRHFQEYQNNPIIPKKVIGIDVGLKNMGIVHLSVQPPESYYPLNQRLAMEPHGIHVCIDHWSIHQVHSRGNYDIKAYTQECLRLIRSLRETQLSIDSQKSTIDPNSRRADHGFPDIFAIEKQLLAPQRSSSIAGNSKMLSWEALMFGILLCQQEHVHPKSPKFDVFSIPSNSTSSLFGLRPLVTSKKDFKNSKERKKLKKLNAIHLVNQCVENGNFSGNIPCMEGIPPIQFSLPDTMRDVWRLAKKQDDYADCFLVGMLPILYTLQTHQQLRKMLTDTSNQIKEEEGRGKKRKAE